VCYVEDAENDKRNNCFTAAYTVLFPVAHANCKQDAAVFSHQFLLMTSYLFLQKCILNIFYLYYWTHRILKLLLSSCISEIFIFHKRILSVFFYKYLRNIGYKWHRNDRKYSECSFSNLITICVSKHKCGSSDCIWTRSYKHHIFSVCHAFKYVIHLRYFSFYNAKSILSVLTHWLKKLVFRFCSKCWTLFCYLLW
jgi:hypothetical protein